jgi:hypothetical protein
MKYQEGAKITKKKEKKLIMLGLLVESEAPLQAE